MFSLVKLEVIEWAINLASQDQPNYPSASTRQHRRRGQRFSPQNQPLASPVTPVIPRVNQSNHREPVYASIQPTVQGRNPSSQRPIAPERRATAPPTTSSEEATFLATDTPFYCYYPESIYVSDHLPTRSPRALQAFKEHCRLQFVQVHQPLLLQQPLERAREITPSPLNFQNLLWRSSVTVSHYGIFEEYHWIRRQQRPHAPDRAILQPAYKVFYGWQTDGWSVSRLPRTPVNEPRTRN